MRGVNLLPPEYRASQRRRYWRKGAYGLLAVAYLVSGVLMALPSLKLRLQKETLRGITYRLQDTRFDEVKALGEAREGLLEQIEKEKARIAQVAQGQRFVIEPLYNIVETMPSGMATGKIILDCLSQTVVIEGESRAQETVMNRLKTMQSIYPTGKVDFVVSPNGEGGYLFQIQLLIGEGQAYEGD